MKAEILIVEDRIITADYLGDILTSHGYRVLEPSITYSEAVKELAQSKPDLVILDIHLGEGKTGIDLAHYINDHYQIPFVFLTSFSDSSTLEQAKETYPAGYLTKPFKKENVIPTIEIVLSNTNKKNVIEDEVAKQLATLTPTELKILKLISENQSTSSIAGAIFVSQSTVKNHRHNICKKLELGSRNNALISWALSNRSAIDRHN